jgi:hypothetical protein
MASVVFTPAQITQIATYFAQKQFVGPPSNTAIASTDQIKTGISTLAMSISIGGGTVSYSPAFSPPLNNLNTTQQAALICYIIQMAMGVPLV